MAMTQMSNASRENRQAVGEHLQDGADHPQVAGHGLLQRQELDALVLQLDLLVSHLFAFLHHLLRQLEVLIGQGFQ